MAVPRDVHFNRFAQMTGGLVTIGPAPENNLFVNGVAAVTGWLSGSPWIWCLVPEPVVWTECAAGITTTWEDCINDPSTSWTECEGA